MEQKIRKISRLTFSEKYRKLRKKHKAKKEQIQAKYLLSLKNAQSSQQRRVIRKRYKQDRLLETNRFALTYNAIKNEQLYRKGVKESEISKVKAKFNARRFSEINFEYDVEKKALTEKIRKIANKYSRPVSTTLRKTRIEKSDEKLKFIKVPFKTPLQQNTLSLLVIFLAAFISTIALDVFIKPFGIYNAGLRGITQSLYYVILNFNNDTQTWVSYLLFIAFNIPLAIFGYLKIGKKFALYTIIYLSFQYLISFILDFWGVEEFIKPFGRSPREISQIVVEHSFGGQIPYSLPLLSAFIGGILYGIAIGLIYLAGASGGGSKFIVTYISITKDKSVGKIAMLFSVFVVSFGLIINHIVIGGANPITAFSSITLFASVIFIFSSNLMIDSIFAKSRKEKISVITTKKNAILRFLDVKMMYNRSFTSMKVETSFNKNKKDKLEFLVSATESRMLMKVFYEMDPRAIITSYQVHRIYGRFYAYWFE